MSRIAPLDGIRGLAILLVLLWHYAANQIVTEPGTIGAYLLVPLRLSVSGVDLFFVLSGFLITGILLDNKSAANLLRVFYVRRICRIFPLYFLLLGLFIGLAWTDTFAGQAYTWLFADPLPIWTYATFTQNIAMGMRGDLGPHWLGVTWSLAVEEQFYLFIPVLVFLLPRRYAFAVIAAAILLAPVLRHVAPGLHAHINTPWRSDSLLSGAALAFLVRWTPFSSAVQRRPEVLAMVLAVLIAGAALMTARPGVLGVFGYCWLGLLYTSIVLHAFSFSGSVLARLLSVEWLVWFGQRSYAIYMFHEAASGLLHGFINQQSPRIASAADAALTLLALGVTLMLAELSYRMIERPALRFGHRVKYRSETRY